MKIRCDICFFFKQKTAYEMRISDWSSDVCSSDLKGACLRSRSKSVRLAGCPQDRGALLGHFLLFVRRDDQNGYVGPGRGDVKSARFIGVGVAGDAQPSETRADAGAHIGLEIGRAHV